LQPGAEATISTEAIAANHGDITSAENRDSVAKDMTLTHIEKAENLARGWKVKKYKQESENSAKI